MVDVETLELHHPDGQVFTFEPGSLALAFAATGPGPREGPLAIFQTLHAPSDLERWAKEVVGAELVRATRQDLERALHLQAAIWAVANALVDRRPVVSTQRAALNELAAQPDLVPRISARGQRSWARGQGASALLSSVARDAIDVLGGPRATDLKRCEGTRCYLLFIDTSRSGHRRWCSMDRCGNRAKVAAHRRRRKEHVS